MKSLKEAIKQSKDPNIVDFSYGIHVYEELDESTLRENFLSQGIDPEQVDNAVKTYASHCMAATFHRGFLDFMGDKGGGVICKIMNAHRENIQSSADRNFDFVFVLHSIYIWLNKHRLHTPDEPLKFADFRTYRQEELIDKIDTYLGPNFEDAWNGAPKEMILAAGYEPLISMAVGALDALKSYDGFLSLPLDHQKEIYFSLIPDLETMAIHFATKADYKPKLSFGSPFLYGGYTYPDKNCFLVDIPNKRLSIDPNVVELKPDVQECPHEKRTHHGCLASYVVSEKHKTTLIRSQSQLVFELAFDILLKEGD